MHKPSDWVDLLVDAGATACPKCGKTASISARVPDDGGVPSGVGAAHGSSEPGVRVCFECGHEHVTAAR